MQLEKKTLTLAASVLFVALSQSEAGNELITSGHITINDTDFKLEDGMVLNHPVFIPPSADDIREYVEHMGYLMKVERFHSYQTMRGWKLPSGQQIVDWRASVDTWMTYEKITPNKIETAKQIWDSA